MKLLYTPKVQQRWIALSLLTFLAACSGPVRDEAPPPEPEPQPEPVVVAQAEPEPAQPEPQPAPEPVEVRVKPDHPSEYVVQKGDTLWDISARFLQDPWVWPAIWDVNPQIANPHLIYPGDVISLVYIDGRPVLIVDGDGKVAIDLGQTSSGKPIVRLSPRIRAEALDQAIPIVPADAIEQFTVNPRVLTREQRDGAPYIVGNFDGRLVSASGNQIYVRGIVDDGEALYSIFRPQEALIDPESQEILGYEVAYVGDAKVLEYGDPATLVITESKREALTGDLVLPLNRGKISHNYVPRVPSLDFDGTIISLFDALSQAAQNQVVVINLGQRDGMERGDILGIEKRGAVIRDVVTEEAEDTVQLPDTRIGIAMIFRVFDRVSYGLIMESTRVVEVGDIITNP
ncbi:MAG: LysM peptidoglycan-binding domain-containing protein [Pseudomonadota bacterium]